MFQILGEYTTFVGTPKIRFPMCCCVSKPQRIKGDCLVENRGQISHLFTPLVKLGDGLVKDLSNFFRATRKAQSRGIAEPSRRYESGWQKKFSGKTEDHPTIVGRPN